jgi:hypothetical protein
MRTKADYVPSLRRHKPTNQAVCTLNGRDHYLGKFGTKESKKAYDALIGEWLRLGRQMPTVNGLSVNEVILFGQRSPPVSR